MKAFITIIFLSLCIIGEAQFPFEIYPKLTYDIFEIVHGKLNADSGFLCTSNILDKNRNEVIRIVFREKYAKDSTNIFIYRNSQLVQKIVEPDGFQPFVMSDSLYAGDINNDGLLDIKMFCFNPGCGLAAFLLRKIYLIGRLDGTFDKYSFMDFSDEIERDFNGDKNYEIISLDHTEFENHSYWVYDLFDIRHGQFVNVSKEFDYPIMIQHLYRMNYSTTNKISREEMKDFSRSRPDLYDERK